jgi:polyribonucleotide nucleotidyltransferase
MDIKVTGINSEIMAKALEQARAGRLHILGEMAKTLGSTRGNMSTFAPRIVTIKIPVDKIRDVIGPGGKMIRSIIERTGVKIDVEDSGSRERRVGRRRVPRPRRSLSSRSSPPRPS